MMAGQMNNLLFARGRPCMQGNIVQTACCATAVTRRR